MSTNNNKVKNKNSKKITNKRASSLKIFSITSVLIVLAIVLVLNILLSQTLDTYLTFDLSSTSQNSVSEQTIEYINSLPSDTNIRIVGLFTEPESVTNTPYEYIIPMLKDLEGRSGGRVTVSYIDPDLNPSIIPELDPKGVANLSKEVYAVSCNGKIRVIDPYMDCFNYDQVNGLNYPIANKSEATFVNTIVSLLSESHYKVYFLSGIQEAPHTYLDAIFASMNIETADLPVTEPFVVPDDCSLLIINNPDVDISESVQEGLKNYIKNGNNPVNIICSLGLTQNNANENFEHLNNVLAEVNLSVGNNYVYEENADYIINPETFVFKGTLTDEYKDLNSAGIVVYQTARPVFEVSRASSSIGSSPLITTSSNATLLDLTSPEGEAVNVSNPYTNVAATGYYVGTINPVNVYVFGTCTFTSDLYLNQASSNDYNIQTIRNIISRMFTTEVNLDIPAKMISDYSIDVRMVDANKLSIVSVVFIAVIPIAFVIVAALVYHKRSHL